MAHAPLIRLIKSIYFSTPLWRYFLPVMKFDMTIAQLNFITCSLESIKADGNVLEIGVGGGATSVVINTFMQQKSIKRPFFAIDTFSGFLKDDADFERTKRGKTDSYSAYRSNRMVWYEKTLRAHDIEPAQIVQADAKLVDYSKFAPLAFCLLDVDLYRPVEVALPRLYEALAPGGMIIIDDCDPEESIYDGAGEAYRNFCCTKAITPEITHDKLGIVRKLPQ